MPGVIDAKRRTAPIIIAQKIEYNTFQVSAMIKIMKINFQKLINSSHTSFKQHQKW